MEVLDPLGFGNEGLAGLLGEFGLDLDRLLDRPHARELVQKHFACSSDFLVYSP